MRDPPIGLLPVEAQGSVRDLIADAVEHERMQAGIPNGPRGAPSI